MTGLECQRCRALMDDWLNSELLVETTQEMLRHLDACQACRAELDGRQAVRARLHRALDARIPPDLRANLTRALAASSNAPVRAHSERARMPQRWWVPSAIGLAVATAAVVLVAWIVQGQPVSAAELLTQSSRAELQLAGQRHLVLHRALTYEERALPSGQLLASRRIEVWRDGRTGLTARRVYGAADHVVAGEWRHADGSATVYERGEAPARQAPGDGVAPLAAVLDARELWRLDVSATQFLALVPAAAEMTVERTAQEYALTYQASAPDGRGISSATLVLRREDLRPVRETLVVGADDNRREYRFIERRFEPLPVERVAAHVFEPDAELVSLPSTPHAIDEKPRPTPVVRTPPPTPIMPVDPALLVEALYGLHRVGADLREAPQVSRDRGVLQIRGVVASEERRSEWLAALGPIATHPSTRIEIGVDERPITAAPQRLANLDASPAGAAVRQYFEDFIQRRLPSGNRPSGDDLNKAVDEAAARMVARVRDRAARAHQRAVALSALTKQFGTVNPDGLSLDATATWQTMLRDHARGVKHDTEALRLELQPVFFATATPDDSSQPIDLTIPEVLVELAQRMTNLTERHRAAVDAAFTSGDGAMTPLALDSDEIWRSMLELERLAGEFERPWSLKP